MGFDMTPEEYRRLWRSFDADGDGKISYNEFNNLVGPLIHPRINADLARPMTIAVKKGHARALARGMQQRLGPDVEAAFRELDADRSGYISHQEFVQVCSYSVGSPHRRSCSSPRPPPCTAPAPCGRRQD